LNGACAPPQLCYAPATGRRWAARGQHLLCLQVRHLWRFLSDHTQGSARIDLRRPVPPHLNPYTDNLLFTSSKPRRSKAPRGARAAAAAVRWAAGRR
jgi:hypothetical protein